MKAYVGVVTPIGQSGGCKEHNLHHRGGLHLEQQGTCVNSKRRSKRKRERERERECVCVRKQLSLRET
jgi:hypothetical protein